MVCDINEHKRIESELEDTLRRLRLQLDNSPVAVIEFDADLRVNGWSAHAQRIFGWTAGEVLGKAIPELPWVYEDDAKAVAQVSAEMTAGHNLSNLSCNRNHRKDGSLVYCEWYNSAILGADGKLVSVLSLVLDVTERAEAQHQIARLNQDLARRVKELETLLDVIPTGIGIVDDAQCRSIRVNPAFAAMLGIPADANASKTGPLAADLPYRMLQNGLELPARQLPMQVAVRKGARVAPTDLEIVRDDGETLYVCGSAAPLFDEQGRPRGSVGAFVDITDRKRSETALRESEARFRASEERLDLATQAAGIGIFDWDIETGMVVWTEQAERIFGLEPGTFEGNFGAWVKRLDAGDRTRFERLYEECVRQRRPVMESEFRVVWPDGTEHWISSRGRIYYDAEGGPKRMIGTKMDITERRRADEAIRQKQKLESIGLLAGGIAHDFNNLLVGIVGGASLLREMLSKRHAALPILDAIGKSGEQAAHLTRQLLAYAGKGRFYVERVDLAEAARATCELLKSSIPQQVEVTIDSQPAPQLEGDKGQIQQLVMNLVINAAEAIGTSMPGKIAIRTGGKFIDADYCSKVLADSDLVPGWYAYLEVEDTGCGMDAETMSRIFDPFFTTKFTGRGLGLAAVHGIVRGNKGAIRVVSKPGRGATITIYLPAAEAAEPAPFDIPAEAGIILVADDQDVVCRVAETALERGGYTPYTVTDGKAALEFFRKRAGQIRLVLLDMRMPGMSGKEILREIRRIRADVPVIVTSGYGESDVAREFSGENIDAFLEKPFTARDVIAKVEETLGRM